MKLIAAEKVTIGYDELADPDDPGGRKLVVTYKKGQEIPDDRPIANLNGLIDQGYLVLVGDEGEEMTLTADDVATLTLGEES